MAARFWVGGTGTWDTSSTTHWSATSGGASGASAPTTADTVTIDANSGSGTITTASGATCSTCTLNSSNIGLTLGAAQTITGAFTLTLGTLSLGSYKLTCATFASNNSNTRTIAFGTGNIEVNSTGNVWNTSTITGLTTTGTQVVNVTNSGSTNITITPGSLSESNSISFNISSGTYQISINSANGSVRNLDFTGFSGTFTAGFGITIYGNIILSSTMTSIGASATTMSGTSLSTQTITSNGSNFIGTLVVDKTGGTVKLNDAFNQTTTGVNFVGITVTNGTFDANNFNVSCVKFASNNSNTRTITMGSGTWTVSAGSVGTLVTWALGTTTGLTFNKNTANIILIANRPVATANNIFTGGGLTYNNLTISGTTTPVNVQINSSNTFATLSNSTDRTITRTYIFNTPTTTTVSTWDIYNTSGTATLNSLNAGTRFTVSQSSGTVNVSNCTIQDSAATGGATWNAFTSNNNVDAGNNTGWIFTAPATSSMLIMF